MPRHESDLANAGAALLGERLSRWRAAAGGDLSQVIHARMASGREVIVKSGPAPPTEARMLLAMADAGAPAPRVLAVSDAVLVLEALAEDGRGLSAAGWADLGDAMRRMHDANGQGYGWPEDYAFGPVAIPSPASSDWPDFWARHRLLPGVGALDRAMARRLERLVRNLPERLPARPVPSLLHGDLWSGNVLAAQGRLTGLVDPACYRGDSEVDLAMLHLFGSPGRAFDAGYGPLAPGAADRRPIYQLWPALVHVRLFGAGYLGMVARLLNQAGV